MCCTFLVILVLFRTVTVREGRGTQSRNWRQRLGAGSASTGDKGSSWRQYGTLWPWFGQQKQGSSAMDSVPRGELAYRDRCPVYTYVDLAAAGGDNNGKMLAAWKRAWLAAGFRPVVLGRAHAQQHPLCARLTGRVLRPSFIHPWMALCSVGGGIYAELEVIPFYSPNDASMNYLRECTFKELGTFSNVKNGVFFGSRQNCEDVISFLTMSRTRGVRDCLKPGMLVSAYPARFQLRRTKSLAYYSEETEDLPALVSTHLHEHFLRTHSEVQVLDPLEHGALSLSVIELATALAQCPNPPSNSCPPHLTDCGPCHTLHVTTIASVPQTPTAQDKFCIVTVPHPLTYLALFHRSFTFLEGHFLIRDTKRDGYLYAIGHDMAPKWAGALQIAILLSDRIKASSSWATSAWVTWEEDEADYDLLVSLVGFAFKRQTAAMTPSASYDEMVDLLATANKALLNDQKRKMIESWNLESTEFWHYVRSFQMTIANV